MYTKRTYKDFSRKQIARIAIEYANSSQAITESYFTKEYNISSNTFYTILHNAVSNCIVSEKTAKKIQAKACANSYAIAGKTARSRSFNAYQRLLEKRAFFEFSNSEAKKYAQKFAKCNLSLDAFSQNHAIPEKLLIETLERVIQENLVSAEIIDAIRDKQATYYTIEFDKRNISKKEFCNMYPISTKLLGEFLMRAITKNLVSDEIVNSIRNNALIRNPRNVSKINELFDYWEEKRRIYNNG